MCGRYYSPDEAAMERAWYIGARSNQNPFRGVYNAAPSLVLPIMRAGTGEGLELARSHWGFLTAWAGIAKPQINARAETVGTKPLFRAAFKNGRCLVPAVGWYEWQTIAGEKWPHFVTRQDGQLFAFAGIETTGTNGERNYAIVTCYAADDLKWLHHRMRVVLDQQAVEQWLGDKDSARARATEAYARGKFQCGKSESACKLAGEQRRSAD